MASIDAYDAIHDYIVAEWAGAPLRFENDSNDLDGDPASQVVVEVFGSFLNQDTIGAPGNNRWIEGGQIYCHVLTIRGSGSRTARMIASDLSQLFRERTPDARLQFKDMSIGAGEPAEEDGVYFRMTLTIDWQWADYTSA